MSTILAYTSPASGHAFPLMPGLLELVRRGHRVHLRTAASAVPRCRAAGIDASPVDPRIEGVEVTDYLADTDRDRLVAGFQDVLRRAPIDAADLDDAIATYRPDVLLVDANAHGALAHAEASGLPWALAMPSLLPLPERGIPPYGMALRPARGPLGHIRDRVLWPIVERAFGKAILPRLNEVRRAAGLAEFRSTLDQWDACDLVLCLTGSPLEYPRHALPSHVAMVGFQPWDPPGEVPAFLDEPGHPWVLVTCSTDYQGDEQLARVAAEALRDRPYRVLLTIADAYDRAGVDNAGNVFVRRFVPHDAVLARAAAVVTHGGMGIVGKATRAGVPIVAVPFGRDQPEIARRITEAGTGVSLPPKRLTAERLRAAVDEAVSLAEHTRAVADELGRTDPAGDFADAVAERLLPRPRCRA
ncbi:glycosyltransferase [Gordonia sp. SID5947]|uniref:glycosyltransferase n=1 Tax=Gordonia sp. SID5947 TaxID=2690315 RepID=UPI00137161FA|nr:glycosyltransferase [Gordonia sp. SID5947]MYR07416.1 glycosyltransferase [Gordonia sp. SID5947]